MMLYTYYLDLKMFAYKNNTLSFIFKKEQKKQDNKINRQTRGQKKNSEQKLLKFYDQYPGKKSQIGEISVTSWMNNFNLHCIRYLYFSSLYKSTKLSEVNFV